MLNAKGKIIYIGKAKHLKKRVSSYFSANQQSTKTASMVKQIASIEVTVTRNEIEALLLEQRLIKAHRPKYNILFRDDKSYPYAYLNTQHPYPRLIAYRGAKPSRGRLFGPYPSMHVLQKTVQLLYQIFRIRQCQDSVFANRSRPCLQYQINRCSAPCVGLISEQAYQQDIEAVSLFLQGKNQSMMAVLMSKMTRAAEEMRYELAAKYRDQINALRAVQQDQVVETKGRQGFDIIAIERVKQKVCLYLLMIRNGQMLGGRHFLPEDDGLSDRELLEAFILQWYTDESITIGQTSSDQSSLRLSLPNIILWSLSCVLSESVQQLLQQVHPELRIGQHASGIRQKWLDMAKANAQQTLLMKLKLDQEIVWGLQALQAALLLSEMPVQLECFDISHTQGEATVASCVVLTETGLAKSLYRRYKIENVTQGDDYAAIHQAVMRRYKRQLSEDKPLPQVIIIDGGKGQLSSAADALVEVGLHNVVLLSISKGPARRAGQETIWRQNQDLPLQIAGDSRAHLLLQKIRDEAHRFAITGHRRQRHQSRMRSTLQDIPGIGAKRRQALLNYFGGWQQLKVATIEEIAVVLGMSKQLASKVYQALNDM